MLRRVAVRAAIVSLGILAPVAEAQVARVFVSVNGNDLNVCSNIATPCRTLAGGITQVDADGEVIVIESGSYAGGTITKAVKINVASGVVAFSGLPIVVNPGGGGRVVLRGLTVKAVMPGSGIGIQHQSGLLYVENSVVDGWFTGLDSENSAEKLFVTGSVFRNNVNAGAFMSSPSKASIDNSAFQGNGTGVYFFNGGTGRVSNSVISGNGYGGYVDLAGSVATFQRCEVSDNSINGLYASNAGVLRVAGSTVTRNGTGLNNFGATLTSFGNNVILDNVTNTVGMISTALLQ
jgi:hypothetical protein